MFRTLSTSFPAFSPIPPHSLSDDNILDLASSPSFKQFSQPSGLLGSLAPGSREQGRGRLAAPPQAGVEAFAVEFAAAFPGENKSLWRTFTHVNAWFIFLKVWSEIPSGSE